ncbi:MFS transporter [Peterkaempfera griseoplana]|uniref:MFS transporter n=1 Tax=Peterkaempfera griseoplana TaxID=66896 RepID=UPI0006E200EE|nr:MFS transporter [Peterkaempfera griseoplana]
MFLTGDARRARPPLGSAFRLVWASATLSGFGDGMRFVALPLLASGISGDPRDIALVFLAEQAPWLLLAVPAGAVADRVDRRRLLWTVDAVRALVAALPALLVVLDSPSIPLLAATGFLLGAGEVLHSGAWAALVPALVGPEDRPRANAAVQAGMLIGDTLVGTPLGALVFAVAAAGPFVVDAVSFTAAALLMALVPGDFRPRADGTGALAGSPVPAGAATFRRHAVEGVRRLWHQPLLRRLCLIAGVSNLVLSGLIAVLVLFARDRLGLGGPGYGLLVASFAVGGLVGAGLAPRLAAGIGPGRLLRLIMPVAAVLVGAVGMASSGVVAGCLIAAYGAASTVWGITSVSVRQSLVPPELLGRVGTAYQTVSLGAGAVGAAAAGEVGHTLGLRAPFLLGAVLLLAAGGAALGIPAGLRPVAQAGAMG